MQLSVDPRRADRERRYKPPPPTSAPAEDLTTDYMNILGNSCYGPPKLQDYYQVPRSCLAFTFTFFVLICFEILIFNMLLKQKFILTNLRIHFHIGSINHFKTANITNIIILNYRYGILNVWINDAVKVVCMDSCILLQHQFC